MHYHASAENQRRRRRQRRRRKYKPQWVVYFTTLTLFDLDSALMFEYCLSLAQYRQKKAFLRRERSYQEREIEKSIQTMYANTFARLSEVALV